MGGWVIERLNHALFPRRFDVFISGVDRRPRFNSPQKNPENLQRITTSLKHFKSIWNIQQYPPASQPSFARDSKKEQNNLIQIQNESLEESSRIVDRSCGNSFFGGLYPPGSLHSSFFFLSLSFLLKRFFFTSSFSAILTLNPAFPLLPCSLCRISLLWRKTRRRLWSPQQQQQMLRHMAHIAPSCFCQNDSYSTGVTSVASAAPPSSPP